MVSLNPSGQETNKTRMNGNRPDSDKRIMVSRRERVNIRLWIEERVEKGKGERQIMSQISQYGGE